MTDRKIWKAVLCFAMSIVLAVPGCAANTPASELAQSDLQEAAQGGTGQEAAGQDSALQENTEQAAAGEEISEQKETSGDVFDFEEGDQSTPAAAGEMPSSRQNLTFEMSRSRDPGSFLRSGFRIPSEPVGVLEPSRQRRSAFWAAGLRKMTVIRNRLSICRRSISPILPTRHWTIRRIRRMERDTSLVLRCPPLRGCRVEKRVMRPACLPQA